MSDKALAPRTSALVSVPTRTELESLSPADLWTLEERASEVQEVCRELNDERLRRWVEVEGKTQRKIAAMVGRSPSNIARRASRLGLVAKDNRGGNRVLLTCEQNEPEPPDDAEEVDAEIVEDVPGERPPARPAAGGPAYADPDLRQGASDPGPRVKCPTCGHMVKPDDIGAW